MSGGKFNYNCFKVSELAEDIKHQIEINDEPENTEDWGAFNGGLHLGPEALEKVIAAQATIEYAGRLAREVEWLYSSDHGEESFLRAVKEINDDVGNSILDHIEPSRRKVVAQLLNSIFDKSGVCPAPKEYTDDQEEVCDEKEASEANKEHSTTITDTVQG